MDQLDAALAHNEPEPGKVTKLRLPRAPRATPGTHPMDEVLEGRFLTIISRELEAGRAAYQNAETRLTARIRVLFSTVALEIHGPLDPDDLANVKAYYDLLETLVANACFPRIQKKLRVKFPGLFPIFTPAKEHLTVMPLDGTKPPDDLARKCVNGPGRVVGYSLAVDDDQLFAAHNIKMQKMGTGMARTRTDQLDEAVKRGHITKAGKATYVRLATRALKIKKDPSLGTGRRTRKGLAKASSRRALPGQPTAAGSVLSFPPVTLPSFE